MGIRPNLSHLPHSVTISRSMAWLIALLLFAPWVWKEPASAAERVTARLKPIENLHDFVDACESLRQDIAGSGQKEREKLREGLQQFSRGNYSSTAKALAVEALRSETGLGDYALYYRGLALKSAQDRAGAMRAWQQLLEEFPQNPLAAMAAVRLAEAAMDQGDYQTAGSFLQAFRNTKDPQVLLTLAKASAGFKDYPAAGQLLEMVYFDFPLCDEARQAGTLLQALRQTGKLKAGWDYGRYASRIESLLADSRTSTAFAESSRWPLPQQEPERSLVLLIKGKCSYFVARASGAITLLKMVGTANPEIHAQALLYLALSQRKLNQFDRFMLTCQALQNRYPDSKSTEEALFNLANHYSLKERAGEASQIFSWLAERFPGGEFASQAHWKLIWNDYLAGHYSQAIDGIFTHLSRFPESLYRRAAFYWLGRSFEQVQDIESAKTVFGALVGNKANDYYSLLAEKALTAFKNSAVVTDRPGGELSSSRLRGILSLARPRTPLFPAGYLFDPSATRRILELSAANLPQQALSEIASQEGMRGPDLGLQLLKAQTYAQIGDRWNAVRTLSRAIPQYSAMEVEQLPRQVWEIFYPLEHWKAIQTSSQKLRLDPLLVAAVIRQESLFNASARSPARAMGLMQIIQPTGIGLARRLQTTFSTSKLYNGEYNVRLGTLYLSDLLNRYKGQLHQALAAYNAGEGRVDRWNGNLPRESEEFVESIPFTETRDYVKRIFTHWTHYRQLYAQ
jgi:soluble lytic murein transglycosylase